MKLRNGRHLFFFSFVGQGQVTQPLPVSGSPTSLGGGMVVDECHPPRSCLTNFPALMSGRAEAWPPPRRPNTGRTLNNCDYGQHINVEQ